MAPKTIHGPRRATDADVDLLVALNAWVHDLHVANDPAVYRPTDPAEVAGWFRTVLAGEDKEVWVVDRLGYVVLELHERSGSPFSHPVRLLRIDQIAVDGGARRQGVGKALMDLATSRAEELGCARLVLDVAAFNAEALAFYEALGFRPAAHRLTRS